VPGVAPGFFITELLF